MLNRFFTIDINSVMFVLEYKLMNFYYDSPYICLAGYTSTFFNPDTTEEYIVSHTYY